MTHDEETCAAEEPEPKPKPEPQDDPKDPRYVRGVVTLEVRVQLEVWAGPGNANPTVVEARNALDRVAVRKLHDALSKLELRHDCVSWLGTKVDLRL